VVLAEDIIWSERLARLLREVGAEPIVVRDAAAYETAIVDAGAVLVDLTAVRVDPLLAIERARAAELRILAVGQHDDHALRKRALAAGAERVFAYRKLFEDGEATLRGWLASPSPVA
jgi:DNA-binding response OmpR family regulator